MEKINIAELLRDCPKGMELDCMIYDNIVFDSVSDWVYPIRVTTKDRSKVLNLTKYGCTSENENAKCVIFPKGKTTWEGFVPPYEFKDGDIAISDRGGIHLLRTKDSSYCAYRDYWIGSNKFDNTITTSVKIVRLATEEEKQKLFQAIKDNGYRWNAEKKELEKLEVNKFDITTLKEFDKVLVRDCNEDKWNIDFFSYYRDNGTYQCMTFTKNQCIPYEGNQHLLSTTNDCDDFYKTWE